jgi:aspartate/methionine/tyrosine aminotransferase
MLISSSKMFSYAGQRVAIAVISPYLMKKKAPNLEKYFGTPNIGHAFIHGGLYAITACVPAGSQYGLTAFLNAAVSGKYKFLEEVKEYAERAKYMKKAFLENGFNLVYENDLDKPLADGFYFTISYPAYDDGAKLLEELLCYGISAITLSSTGSVRKDGLRVCVSMTGKDQYETLSYRLNRFSQDHPLK